MGSGERSRQAGGHCVVKIWLENCGIDTAVFQNADQNFKPSANQLKLLRVAVFDFYPSWSSKRIVPIRFFI
jgi:hypothetical protein